MKINEINFKQIITLEWSDFNEMMGNYFLNAMNSTDVGLLDALSTKLDITLSGENMYQVYVNDTLIVSSQKYFSEVNVYNILRFGAIKTYVQGLDG